MMHQDLIDEAVEIERLKKVNAELEKQNRKSFLDAMTSPATPEPEREILINVFTKYYVSIKDDDV